jgi:hypothetical protein
VCGEIAKTRKIDINAAIQTRGAAMAAIARALLNTIPAISSDIGSLETVALFSGAGLLISLCLAFSGLDGNFGAF